MFRIALFITLIGAGVGQSIVEDLWNIVLNLPVAFENCDNVKVLPSDIIFTLYTRENQPNGITLTTENLNEVTNNRVIFIIHGWLQNAFKLWVLQMKDTYLNENDANIITVDWSKYSGINYGASFCAVPQVGDLVGNFIYNLSLLNIALSNVQINGFSLGGQIAGYAGQQVQVKTNGLKIMRINGLDVAGPGYLGVSNNERLDKTDATFVQGIHTNDNMFGDADAYATADFYVNSVSLGVCGTLQPCCPLIPGVPTNQTLDELLPILFCNHLRAVVYFTASITSSAFLGVPCSCNRFGLGLCRNAPPTVMGENCPSTASGKLFLNPNGVPPYPKGSAGTGGFGGLGGLECLLNIV